MTTLHRTQWMQTGEGFFLQMAERAIAAGLDEPSLLPDWSRAHVIAHFVGNSEALGNLLHWADTGEETPMYASTQARADDIERRAALPPSALLVEAVQASAELLSAVGNLSPGAWQADIEAVPGRTISVSEVPWLRSRESWIHAVDLNCGAWFDALPPSLVDELLTDVTTRLGERDDFPGVVVLDAVDRDRTWTLGAGEPTTVRGTATDLLGWVLGRPLPTASSLTGPLPALPQWL
jgi:maleylpyruvate isomerase